MKVDENLVKELTKLIGQNKDLFKKLGIAALQGGIAWILASRAKKNIGDVNKSIGQIIEAALKAAASVGA